MRAGLLLLIASVATAGSSGERTDTMARIDDEVHAIATALETPSPKMIETAAASGKRVRDLLGQLAGIKGNDSRAADMLAHYPTYLDAVDAALVALTKLAADVHRIDSVSDRCTKDEASLRALLAQKTQHPGADPAADAEAIATKAGALKTTWEPVLAWLPTVDAAVTRDLAATKLALTDGYWMAISANVNARAQEEVTGWADAFADAKSTCAALGGGTAREDVAPVLEQLKQRGIQHAAAATQIITDYNAWLASIREVRALALDARDRIHEALCKTDDATIGEGAGSIANSNVRELADRVASATAEMTRLKAHVADNPAKSKAILDGIKANGAIVAAIGRAEALGRDNPKFRAALAEIRKRREKALTGCSVKTLDLADCGDGQACRVDCVKLVEHTCTLVQPYPDSDDARTDAFAQGKRELAGLQAWYARDKVSLFTRAPAMKKCESKTGLELFTDVTPYAACAAAPALGLGEPLAAVGADL